MIPRSRLFVREGWGALVLSAGLLLRAADIPSPALSRPDDFTFKNWNTEHGLPQMTPRAITQTRDRFLWVGTFNGLARFDGVRFTSFTVGNTPELVSDNIEVLHEDRMGTLWIGTVGGGLVRYRDGVFSTVPDEAGFAEQSVTAICEDGDGSLWVGTLNGLFQVRDDRLVAMSHAVELPGREIVELCADNPGGLWIATPRHVTRWIGDPALRTSIAVPTWIHTIALDPAGDLVISFARGGLAGVRKGTNALELEPVHWKATSCHRGRSGTLWFGTSNGRVSRAHPDGTVARDWLATLAEGSITAIYEDYQGNLWVGAETAGLWRLRPAQVTTYSTDRGLLIPRTTSLCEDQDGRIWVGTFGRGLHVWEGESFRRIQIGHGIVNVTSVVAGRAGSLWCGTFGGALFRRTTADGFEPQQGFGMRLRTIYEDRDGGLWLGTLRDGVEHWHDGRLTRHTAAEGLSNDHVQVFAQDQDGGIWIGTMRGLNRLSDGVIERFDREDGLGGNDIRSLLVDSHGTLWIGSTTGGLTRYRDGRFQTVGRSEGLINDWIEQILEDDDGNLWLGSNAGLMRVSIRQLNDCASGRIPYALSTAFRRQEGLLLPTVGSGFQPSALKTSAGQLWFATSAGIVVIDPKRITPNPNPPAVYIQELLVDGENHMVHPQARASVSVAPGRQRLEFQYTGLDFAAPNAVRFQHKLEGYDPDWVHAGTRREAVYTRVPPGRYRFRVKAANNDGVWTEEGATLAVVVFPAWWQTGWFRAAALLALAGCAFGAYEWRVLRHKEARALQESFSRQLIDSQEDERKRLAGELHDSLGQSLQIIKGRAQLGLGQGRATADPARQLDEISRTAAKAIQEVRGICRALRPAELDQLGLTKAVEGLVQEAREVSGIRFEPELDALDGLLPPETEINLYRIAQECIHNVLHHARASEAIVELKRNKYQVRLSILDNGRGFARTTRPTLDTTKPGLGLVNMAERTRLLRGQFDLQSTPGTGTRITVTVPIPNAPREAENQNPDR